MPHTTDGGMPAQRTPEGLAFDAYVNQIKSFARKHELKRDHLLDQAVAAELSELNAEILAVKDVTGGPAAVHQDTVLGQLSVMYQNDEFIGGRIMPDIFTQGMLSGVYFNYDKRDRLAYPDDSMKDRTDPNELNQNRSKSTYALQPRSLIELLDWLVVQNQSAPLNEIIDLTANVLNGMEFNKEMRIAEAVQTAGNYGGNTTAIAAADRWDTGAGGDPAGVVDAAKAACWGGSGPGKWVGVASLPLHNILKRHPRILDSFKYSAASLGGPKFATRQMIAEYFELDEYLVGSARKDTANVGQTAAYSRIWGNSFSINRVSASPSLRNAVWGYTLKDMPARQELFWLADKGHSGMYKSRCSYSDQQLVIAPTAGYLITTPIG
jgi:hypothetical protein